jgi:hypothetical protein
VRGRLLVGDIAGTLLDSCDAARDLVEIAMAS